MQTTVVSLLSLSAFIYVGVGLLLYSAQRSILYYPTPDMGTFGAETLRIDSGGESLRVLRLNEGRERAIIYFGGNAEPVAANAPAFRNRPMSLTQLSTTGATCWPNPGNDCDVPSGST